MLTSISRTRSSSIDSFALLLSERASSGIIPKRFDSIHQHSLNCAVNVGDKYFDENKDYKRWEIHWKFMLFNTVAKLNKKQTKMG